MKRIALIMGIVWALFASLISPLWSEERDPILQKYALSVVKFNLEQIDVETVLKESSEFVSLSCDSLGIVPDDGPIIVSEANRRIVAIVSYLKKLKEYDVKTVYYVMNHRKAEPRLPAPFLAIPNSPISSEELNKRYPEGELLALEHDGVLLIPFERWDGSSRIKDWILERFFANDAAKALSEIKAVFNAFESESASVVAVEFTPGTGASRKVALLRRLNELTGFLGLSRFDEYYEVEGKIDRLKESLGSCVYEGTKLINDCEWRFDFATRRTRVVMRADSEENAQRLRALVDERARREIKELANAMFNVVARQDGGSELAEIAERGVDEFLEAATCAATDSTVVITINGEFAASTLAKLRSFASKGGGLAPLDYKSSLTRRLNAMGLLCGMAGDELRGYPAAYSESGETWLESGALQKYIDEMVEHKFLRDGNISGVAMLVDEDGIFLPTPGKSTSISDTRDGASNTIAFVELADRNDTRGCITLDEFYEQLQNCPEDRGGYYVAMASGGLKKLDSKTSRVRLKAMTTRAGYDLYLTCEPNDPLPKFQTLNVACARYLTSTPGSRSRFPPAYTADGKSWIEAGVLVEYIGCDVPVPGCAMLIDEDGIFTPTPGKSTVSDEVRAQQAIMFVELADPDEVRACITADEFYEQLQNCPEDRAGYRVVMRGSYCTMIDKSISRDELQALVSKTIDPPDEPSTK